MDKNAISSVSIYPPIGIARLGNSSAYFLASETPGVAPTADGKYKDEEGKVKKQAVRFRLYAFDATGKVLGELTAHEAEISWHVEVANVKAAWYQFNNALDLPNSAIPAAYRNEGVTGNDRKELAIIPSAKSISGINVNDDAHNFDDGEFYGKKVKLGHIETDDAGRLLFFGGDGFSQSVTNAPAVTFANNDGFHDDTSDGVIRATVCIGGREFEATPAMVAVTPPNFGPGLFGVVTMNDVVQDLFIREMNYPNPSSSGVIFWEHIYPILERMTNTQWVNHGFFMLFGKNSPSDFTDSDFVKILQDPSEQSRKERQRVFNWFRNPSSTAYKPDRVPPFYGDGFGEYENIYLVNLPITITQYERLEKWANGDFVTGQPVSPKPFEERSLEEQLDALNQAPMEECLGGPFHPGIELTWPMRVKQMWEAPYRLKVVEKGEATALDFGNLLSPAIALGEQGPLSKSGPGSLTRWLGVPWQTDEASCLSGYDTTLYLPLPSFWAARVPNQVLSKKSYERMSDGAVNIAQRLKHFDMRQDWLRDFGSNYQKKINFMISEWNELGIVAPHDAVIPNNEQGFLPEKSWAEAERHFSETDPTYEQVIYAEKEEVPSLAMARKVVLASAEYEPARERPRRTFARDQR